MQRKTKIVVLPALSAIAFVRVAVAQNCHGVDASAEMPIFQITLPPTYQCQPRASRGYPIPDPTCTPGAINPTVTIEVLRDPAYRTSCTRDSGTTAHQKTGTYDWYGTKHPLNNTGANQTCELDHLISLELGGADTLDNIWPQCGPPGVVLRERYFKQKDLVENFLAAQVKAGAIDLLDAQRGIAADWTQYLDASNEYYSRVVTAKLAFKKNSHASPSRMQITKKHTHQLAARHKRLAKTRRLKSPLHTEPAKIRRLKKLKPE